MNGILVTGATGGLGRNAVDFLVARGQRVTATGRNPEKLAELVRLGISSHSADLAESPLGKLVSGKSAIWHCAALSSPWGTHAAFHAANVTASERLYMAAAAEGVPVFIHISTPALYFDFTHRQAIGEDFRPSRYVNHYAATKAIAESRLLELARKHRDTRLVILRPRAIFGPHDQALFPRLLRLLQKRDGVLHLPRGGKTVLDLTYVENVVHAMWLATQRSVASGSIFNITNDAPVSVAEALQALFVEEMGQTLQIKALPYPLMAGVAAAMEGLAHLNGKEPLLTRYSLGALAFDMTLDLTRAKELLGYAPTITMPEAFRRTAQWINSHG